MGQSTKLPHVALNQLTPEVARDTLLRCCGSQRWVQGMLARRPFESTPALFEAAHELWQSLERADYLEAFSQHPRIGENLSELAKRLPQSARVAAREQAKLARADADTLRALHEENQRYLERFGYIFVVSALGKSAPELLGLLRARLAHDPGQELDVAAEEQAKITALRLAQLA